LISLTFDEFRDALSLLLPPDDRPIVVYSGLWPLYGGLPCDTREMPQRILAMLIDVAGPRRTICMPAFTSGYTNGFLDLDEAPSSSGLFSEFFRTYPGTIRTASAFFSFSCLGPKAMEASLLRPLNAWGDGSFYEWMERHNAHCLMLGTPKANMSYGHRLEWLKQERIPYRYVKAFRGKIKLRGVLEELDERLFVRDTSTGVDNTFAGHEAQLEANGMRSFALGRGLVTECSTECFKQTLLPILDGDAFAFVKNREHFRTLYRGLELTRSI